MSGVLSTLSLGVSAVFALGSIAFIALSLLGRLSFQGNIHLLDENTKQAFMRWGKTFLGISISSFLVFAAIFAYVEINKLPREAVLPPVPAGTEGPTLAPRDTSTPEPGLIPTPTFDISKPTSSLAVDQFVGLYYDIINAATSPDDIGWGWSHLSFALQGASNYDIERYKSEWWNYKVKYEIFRCSETEVEVELTYYPRNDTLFQRPGQTLLLRYTLFVVSGEWVFDGGEVISNRSNQCLSTETNRP